ncbi:MAG: pyridoxal phosphate-dependent aminotransferase [Acidobacteria bacterium]|nr:pyridoxal phosphate-dependent aminotransferase [Acidobacteriota bacterium]
MLLEKKKAAGEVILDLTETNPTRIGLSYPVEEILKPLSHPRALTYQPCPFGLPETRQAIARYYRERAPFGVTPSLHADQIFVTSSTSESYSLLFKLLADPGQSILTPRPSYPLLDYLAAAEAIELRHYQLEYDGTWHLDFGSLRSAVSADTRAVVVVNPNNPTGSYVKEQEWENLEGFCREHRLALICDEVFFDFPLETAVPVPDPLHRKTEVLRFFLGGLSKLLLLPQLKIGWGVLQGPDSLCAPARQRLEILLDTYLSASYPVQQAVPELLQLRMRLQGPLKERLARNLSTLCSALDRSSATILPPEGGWYAVVQVPGTRSEEDWAIQLLAECAVLVHPGYFYEFQREVFLVLSLLPGEAIFREAVGRMRSLL